MRQQAKKWSVLTAAVMLALGATALPQAAQAATSVSGVGTASDFNKNKAVAGTNGTAVGDGAAASGENSTAIGYKAWTNGTEATAIGYKARADNQGAVAIGDQSIAYQTQSIAIGSVAQAKRGASIAVGYTAVADGHYAQAYGMNAQALSDNSIAIGLNAVSGESALDEGSSGNVGATIAIGLNAKATGNGAAVLGAQTEATGEDAVAVGSYASAKGYEGLALGSSANAKGDGGISVGAKSVASGVASSAFGYDSLAEESQSAAFGYASTASGIASTTLGGYSLAKGTAALAVGYKSHVYSTAGTALGYQSYVGESATAGTAIGYQSVAKTGTETEGTALVTTVSFGHENGDTYSDIDANGEHISGTYNGTVLARLTNVAVGKADTDAVNFSQIKTEAGTYIKASLASDGSINDEGTVGKNLKALDTKIGTEQTGNYYTTATASIETKLKSLDTAIGAKTSVTDLYTTGDTVEAQMQKIGNKTIKSMEATTSTGATDTQKIKVTRYDDSTENIEITGQGSVASGDVRLINGGTAYTYLSPATDGTYVKTGATKTTAANLLALDTKIGTEQTGNYYTDATASIETKLKSLDTAIGAKTSVENLYTTDDNVEAQMEKVGKKAIKGVTNATSVGATAAQKATISTYDTNTSYTIEIAGEGAVDSGDKRLLSGGTAYTELRPTSGGEYVKTGNTTAANLSALDTKIGTITNDETKKVKQAKTVSENLEILDEAIANITYTGSDTIEITEGKELKVKNMAMSTVGATDGATATGNYAFAVGGKASATGRYSIALGYDAIAAENTEVTTDPGSTGSSIAIGTNTRATGNGTVVIGAVAKASGEEGIAIGSEAKSEGYEGIALGSAASVGSTATGAMALGAKSFAFGEGASAIGYQSMAYGSNSIAMGVQAKTGLLSSNDQGEVQYLGGGDNSIAIGNYSMDFGNYSVAIGYGAAAGGFSEVGSLISGATAVGFGAGALQQGATAFGAGSFALGKASVAAGLNSFTNAEYSNAFGYMAHAQGKNSTAIGYQALASTDIAEEGDNKVATVSFGHKKDDTYYTLTTTGGMESHTYADTVLSRLTNVAYGTDIHDAAAYGQLIAAGEYSATSDENASQAQTATLEYNDATSNATKVKIKIAAEGKVEDNDKRLVDGDTVYDAIQNSYKGSDTVSIAKEDGQNYYTVRVKNMTQGTDGSLSLGKDASVDGDSATAIGASSIAKEANASAMGANNLADGDEATAIGAWNRAEADSASAIGAHNTTWGEYASTVGYNNSAYGKKSAAFGYKNTVGSMMLDGEEVKANPDTGNNSYAFGAENTVTANKAFVFGAGNTINTVTEAGEAAQDANTFVIGSNNEITAKNAIVIGSNTNKVANNSVVIGNGSTSEAEDTVSVGSSTKQRKIVHVADGEDDTDAATFGQLKQAMADSAYFGSDTISINDDREISVKNMAMSTVGATDGATATGNYAFAVGGKASATGRYSIALGYDAIAAENTEVTTDPGSTGSSIAIGTNTRATGNGTVVIGAVAEASGEEGIAIGSEAKSEGYEATAVGSGAYAKDKSTTALGSVSAASGEAATAAGYQSTAEGAYASAFGYYSQATNTATLALGSMSTASGIGSSAVGYWSKAEKNHDTALGNQSVASAGGATALGTWSHAYGVASNAIGYQSTANASATAGTAIGYQSVAKTALANENGNLVATVSFGHANGDSYTTVNANGEHVTATYSGNLYSRLTNIADGKANTDAAAFGQLVKNKEYTFSDGVATIETNASEDSAPKVAFKLKLSNGSIETENGGYVTGGALYTELRNVTSKNYIAAGNTTAANLSLLDSNLKTVSDKVTTLETNVSNIQTTIGNVKLNTQSLSFDFSDGKTEDTQTIKYKDGNGNQKTFDIKISGISGGGSSEEYSAGNGIAIDDNNKKISVKLAENGGLSVDEKGLAVQKDGEVKSGNTGIVTGGTVYDAILDKTGDTTKLSAAGLGDNLTDSVLTVNDKIGGLSDDINKVGAGAAALAALHPEGYDPADKWSFAVGYGHYKNANAGAIGAFFKPNADTTLSLGGTIGNGDTMMNAGVSFKLGSRSGKSVYRTEAAVSQELASLRKNNEKLTAQNASQQKEISALRADNERMQKQIEMILSQMKMSNQVAKTAK